MKIEIFDDFLPSYQFNQIQSVLMGDRFPWYYNDGIVWQGDGYQFKHTFYNRVRNVLSSPYLPIFDQCLSQLNVKELWRIKANCRPASLFKRFSYYHTDHFPCSRTAILYINTCNGYTKFKKGGKVKSVANRIVIFDSNMVHAGVTCSTLSNEQRRVLVNLNYTE